MHNLEKLGFFLIGAGTGALVASVALEAEEFAPIGEEEAYIPMDDEPEERDDEKLPGDADPVQVVEDDRGKRNVLHEPAYRAERFRLEDSEPSHRLAKNDQNDEGQNLR